MTPSAILETILYAADLDAVEAFYRDVLGFELYAKQSGRQLFYRCGAGMLLIFNPEATIKPPKPEARLPVPPHGAEGPGHVCFRASADEITAWRQRLEAAGVVIEADFRWPAPDGTPGGRSIYFRDPAGNCLEFAEPRIWGLEE
jgi:catechol 2,3-dioxygenase-like lactoylglutathione lyase family enzyme